MFSVLCSLPLFAAAKTCSTVDHPGTVARFCASAVAPTVNHL